RSQPRRIRSEPRRSREARPARRTRAAAARLCDSNYRDASKPRRSSRLGGNTRPVEQAAACSAWLGAVSDASKWALLCREESPLARPASALEERDHHGRQRRCAPDVVVREPWEDRVSPDRRRNEDDLSSELRKPKGYEERDAAAQRVARHIGPVELQILDERRDVLGHQLGADRSINVGRSAMTLQVRGDDLTALREGWKVWPEHRGRPEAAVEQDERMPRPVYLVIELDAVDVGVFARDFALSAPGPFGRLGLDFFVGNGDASG